MLNLFKGNGRASKEQASSTLRPFVHVLRGEEELDQESFFELVRQVPLRTQYRLNEKRYPHVKGGAADVVEVIGSFTSEMELEQWATLCPKEDVEYFLEEVMKKHRLGCPEKDLLVVYRLRVTAPSPADEKEQLPVVRVRAYRRLTQEQRDAYLSEGEVSPDGMCARQGVERRAPAPVSSWERPMLPAPAAIEEGVAALVERTPCFRPGQLAA